MNKLLVGMVVAPLLGGVATGVVKAGTDKPLLERGRYLVMIGGCNDCHTPGFSESSGTLPETEWLTGSPVGFKGPWGTTYPANLRHVMQALSEAEWLKYAREPRRPPMPYWALQNMTENDLRSIYGFVRSLGGKGAPAPAYAPPEQALATPYIDFVPQNSPK